MVGRRSRRRTMPQNRGEPIGDLVRDYDGDVVHSCQAAEELAEADELGGALGHRDASARPRSSARLAVVVGKLCAVVCGDGVEYHKADVVPNYGNGKLVSQDVVLGLKIGRLDAENTVKGGPGSAG